MLACSLARVRYLSQKLAFDRDKIDTGITNPHRKIDPSRYYEPNMALQPRGLLNEEGGTERIPVNAHVSRLPSHKKDERILERHDILGGSQLLARHDLAQKRRVVRRPLSDSFVCERSRLISSVSGLKYL